MSRIALPPTLDILALERLTLRQSGRTELRLQDAQEFASSWFGAECVQIEVSGESTSEYDDEAYSEYGDRCVRGFDQQGKELPALFVADDDDTEDSYYERLASGAATGRVSAEDLDAGSSHTAYNRFTGEKIRLCQGLYYWGVAAHNPYASLDEQLRRLQAAYQPAVQPLD